VRVVSVVTLITATLDLIADFVMAMKLSGLFRGFTCVAFYASVGFFVFVAASIAIYVVEFIDCVITVRQNRETRWLCRLSRSLYLVSKAFSKYMLFV